MPTGELAVSGSLDQEIGIWNTATWQLEEIIKTAGVIRGLVALPDGMLVGADQLGLIEKWF